MGERFRAAGFLVLHAAALVYTGFTLRAAWPWLAIVRLIADHILSGIGLPAWLDAGVVPLVLLPFALVAVFGVRAAARVVSRLRGREPEPAPGLRLRVAVYVIVACVVFNVFILSSADSASGPFRVKVPILGSLTLVVAYGWYARWSLRPTPRLRRAVDLVAMNVSLVLVFAELALRVTARVDPSPLLVTAATSDVVRRAAMREPAGKMRYDFPLNSDGYYDTEFLPASRRTAPVIVDIGDSFSYGMVPHAFHFTTVAEQIAGVEIYNMGYPAIGPTDYAYLLEHEALPLQPERVIVNVFMGNDVIETPALGGPARWYDADDYLVAVVWKRLRLMKRAGMARLPDVAQQGRLDRNALLAKYPWLANPMLEQPNFSHDVYRDVESQAAAVIASERGLPMIDRFLLNLLFIVHAAGKTPVAFMLIPAAFQVDDSLWTEIQHARREPLDRDLAERLTVFSLQCSGTPVLDLLPILRAEAPLADGRRHLYHQNDTHFNARGNAVAGRALGRFIDSLRSPRTARARGAVPNGCGTLPKPATETVVPDVELPLRVDIGEAAARRWMPSGWSNDERAAGESFAWSYGDRSILAIALPSSGDIRMAFSAHPFTYAGSARQRITVVVNGTSVAEVSLAPQRRSYEVTVPAKALRAGVDTIELRYAYNKAPHDIMSSPDVRPLAVAWYAIDFSAVKR